MTWSPRFVPRHSYLVTKHGKHDGHVDAPLVDVRDDLEYRNEEGIAMPVVVIEAFGEEAGGRAGPASTLEVDPVTALWLGETLTKAAQVAFDHYDWEDDDVPAYPRFGESKRSVAPRLNVRNNMPKGRVGVGDPEVDDDFDEGDNND
jgi:hypothetical protein